MTAQKSVLQLSINEKRIRKKAFKTVSGFPGVTSVAMDDKSGKMTVIGEVDVPKIVMKLRKICIVADIVSVDVVKPPEKKPEPEKPAPTKPVIFVPYPDNYYPCQYYPLPVYANSCYPPPYANCKYVDDTSICVIM